MPFITDEAKMEILEEGIIFTHLLLFIYGVG